MQEQHLSDSGDQCERKRQEKKVLSGDLGLVESIQNGAATGGLHSKT